jgi:hypothetical protein
VFKSTSTIKNVTQLTSFNVCSNIYPLWILALSSLERLVYPLWNLIGKKKEGMMLFRLLIEMSLRRRCNKSNRHPQL